MSQEHLIPLQKGDLNAKIFGRQGGKSKSIRKSEGAKLRQIKLRLKASSINDKDQAWLLEKLQNRSAMAADLFLYIEELKRDIHPSQRVALGNLLKDAAKFTHGDKIHTINENLNVNVNIEEWEKRMMDISKENEVSVNDKEVHTDN